MSTPFSYSCQTLYNPTFASYVRERFEHFVPRSNLCRSSSSLFLRTPSHKKSHYDKSCSVATMRLWNALLLEIRTSPSLNFLLEENQRILSIP